MLKLVFGILLLPGIFMVFVPMLPALFYMLVMALGFSLITGFTVITPPQFPAFIGIWLLSVFVDFFSGVIGAKYGGASKKSLVGGVIGLLIGFLFLPPFGGIPGLFVGILISELRFGKSRLLAVKAAAGSLLGVLTGMIINAILAAAFLTLFLIFVF